MIVNWGNVAVIVAILVIVGAAWICFSSKGRYLFYLWKQQNVQKNEQTQPEDTVRQKPVSVEERVPVSRLTKSFEVFNNDLITYAEWGLSRATSLVFVRSRYTSVDIENMKEQELREIRGVGPKRTAEILTAVQKYQQSERSKKRRETLALHKTLPMVFELPLSAANLRGITLGDWYLNWWKINRETATQLEKGEIYPGKLAQMDSPDIRRLLRLYDIDSQERQNIVSLVKATKKKSGVE